jgi:hypothetical protein
MGEVKGEDNARALAASLYTARTLKLETFERYYNGTQYEGREDFFSPKNPVPLLERAPCVVYPVVEAAVRQHADFALGEGRFPTFTTGIGEDDEDDLFGLSEDDSETLDRFLAKLCEHSRFVETCHYALMAGESIGSACVVYSFDGFGSLRAEHVEACHAEPTFDSDGSLVKLEIKYPFIDLFDAEDNTVRARCMFYRRVIDATSDTVFKVAEVLHKGVEPRASIDKERSTEHGLGFVPAIWYAFKRPWHKAGHFDGRPIHHSQLDEIDALNFSLSQRHRAALYMGDPQVVEVGVSPGENPAPTGAAPRATLKELRDSSGNTIYGFGYSERPRNARQKGAGVVWQYENPDAKVDLLSLPGDALKAVSEHAADLQNKVEAVLGYTGTSPEHVKGTLSGKALSLLFGRTTAFVDQVRNDFWSGFMLPSLSLMLRMVYEVNGRSPGSVYISGVTKAAPILDRFNREVADAGKRWFAPHIKPVWGRYFEAGPEEETAVVNTAATAFEKGLVPRAIAIEKLRGVFVFQSAQELAEELDKADEEKQQAALEMAQQSKPNEPTDDKRSTAPGKPKPGPASEL